MKKIKTGGVALAVALIAVIVGAGCSLKFEARLVDPWNRPVAAGTEAASVARARALLAAEVPADTVAALLVDQGLTAIEARRIVALAVTK